MTVILTATDEGEVLEPGIYRVKFAGAIPKDGQVKVDNGDGTTHMEASQYLRWTFEVTEEGFEGTFPLRANSSMAFGPQSKARNWAEVLLRRPIEKGVAFDLDQLIGSEAMASVKHKVVGDKTYAEIESLAPIRTAKARQAPPPVRPLEAVEPPEHVTDDIDF